MSFVAGRLDATALWRLRYTVCAPFYDLAAAGHSEPRRRAIDRLRLRRGERVLLVGAGTGADLPLLPPHVDVLATDLTPSMLQRARARARPGVEFAVMDGQRLDLPDSSFDAALLHQVLAVVPDPARCLAEVLRVVRPGGRISIFDKFTADGATVPRWRRLANQAVDVVFIVPKWPLAELLADLPREVGLEVDEQWKGSFRLVTLHRRPRD
jgi:ubiquinone/menaquinone biosynthesis C-methylase UbiE